MRPIALIRSNIASPIVAFLARVGAPAEHLLRRAGLSSCILTDPEGLIPIRNLVLLMEHARTEGIDNVGLRAGLQARIDDFGVLGRHVCRAATLGYALDLGIRHGRAFSSDGGAWLTHHGDQVRLCTTFTNGFDAEWQQMDHYSLMLLLGMVRLGAGSSWRPAEVQLQTGESAAVRDFEPLSGARVYFGQPATAITFPRALLEAPLRPPRRDRGVLDQRIDAWQASAPADDLAGSMVQVVQMLSWDGHPNIRSTADALGMSVRTLQRHLTSASITHESLVAQARFATAAALLEETDTKVLDIALDLGYSDHAHFTRAFRRWTGRSPREFRRGSRGSLAPTVGPS